MRTSPPYWKTKPLSSLTIEEWEALCDGCARCCLIKFQDEEVGKVYTTRVACKLLDLHRCKCKDYPNRNALIPTCLVLTPELIKELEWIPRTCAYRLLSEGKDLKAWHPLYSKDEESVHKARKSIRNYAISEDLVSSDQLEDYIEDDLKL